MCRFQSSICHLLTIVFHGVLLLLSSRAARHFGLVFHIFYTLPGLFFFSVCVLLRVSYSLSRFLFKFDVAYVFFSATSSNIRKFSSLFLCLFVNFIEVTHWFFLVYFLGPFCFLVSSTHLGALSSCYLELVIRGSMALLPGLFSTFQIYSAFAICNQFYGLTVIYAGSSRLYLVSRKSAHHFVLVGFFLCVVLFASRNVLLFHDFQSSAPAIVRSICGGSSKLYPILCL